MRGRESTAQAEREFDTARASRSAFSGSEMIRGAHAMPVYTYTTLATGAEALGINDLGQIVGDYDSHGFLYSGGTYITLDDPLAKGFTSAYDINNLGQIVGFYSNLSGQHGFLNSGGTYITLDDPLAGAGGTVATGINDSG
jgi:probable HAF family extracellular repeat protein